MKEYRILVTLIVESTTEIKILKNTFRNVLRIIINKFLLMKVTKHIVIIHE